ncbi:MAG: hypothetical protein A2351_06580 [Omnitrophica bacterium RIFOXYB12_FULL_50_7]|nr:MAG: hypothetical protein A2351_06580 [Omnitrophica bacterium RIFOXYB12_FULL_50_7]
MKKRRPFFIFLIVLVILGMLHARLLGMAAEPFLEKVMTRVFDMPVHIEGMRVAPFFARVTVRKLEILNPPGFKRRDHFTCKGIDIQLDLRVLKNKFIRIRTAHFKEVVFAIESYMTPQGSRTNVTHWYHNMGLDVDGPPLPPRSMPHPDNIGEDSWRVRIDRLELEKGSLIFDDRREPEEQRWIFEHIKGYWTGFDFLSDYTSPTFTETIQVEATFGVNPPARFKGGGKCQFADGDNFDVDVQITDGSLAEYEFLLSGILGEVQSGTFDLKSHLLCVEGDLQSEHLLTLKAMTFEAPTATQKLLKYPFDAIRLLLENQKAVELNIKVDGYIEDPKFRVFSAFTKAFQKALISKTKAGITGTMKLAVNTPGQVTHGLGKIGAILVEPFMAKSKTNAGSTGEKKNA